MLSLRPRGVSLSSCGSFPDARKRQNPHRIRTNSEFFFSLFQFIFPLTITSLVQSTASIQSAICQCSYFLFKKPASTDISGQIRTSDTYLAVYSGNPHTNYKTLTICCTNSTYSIHCLRNEFLKSPLGLYTTTEATK